MLRKEMAMLNSSLGPVYEQSKSKFSRRKLREKEQIRPVPPSQRGECQFKCSASWKLLIPSQSLPQNQ